MKNKRAIYIVTSFKSLGMIFNVSLYLTFDFGFPNRHTDFNLFINFLLCEIHDFILKA